MVFPLTATGRVVGALSFGALTAEREWPDVLVQRLQLLADIFANALARQQAERALQRALADVTRLKQQLEAENAYLREAAQAQPSDIVGNSPALKRVLSQVDHVAPTEASVLLLGETGTGKELLAHLLHRRSRRQDRTMVTLNCAALPPTLIEAELFGREKGAYTGALTRQAGRFELADGSTIFLDEIAELPLELQVKLLRVLEDGQLERLGSTKTLTVDVRVIAATNRDLAALVARGTFREDLYYRLNVFPIAVPPLRERGEDIPLLVWTFAKQFGQALGKPIERIPQETMDALRAYPWPGNIRELRNVIERAVILTDSSTLRVAVGTAARGPRGRADARRHRARADRGRPGADRLAHPRPGRRRRAARPQPHHPRVPHQEARPLASPLSGPAPPTDRSPLRDLVRVSAGRRSPVVFRISFNPAFRHGARRVAAQAGRAGSGFSDKEAGRQFYLIQGHSPQGIHGDSPRQAHRTTAGRPAPGEFDHSR